MNALLSGVLQNAVLVTGLAVAVWCVTRVVRRPALASVLWLLVLVKLLTPPLVPVSVPAFWGREAAARRLPVPPVEFAAPPIDPLVEPEEQQTPPPEHSAPAERVPAPRIATVQWPWVIMAVWSLGSLAWVALAASRIRTFQQCLRLATPATGRMAALTTRTAALLKFDRAPRVMVVGAHVSPMVWPAGWTPLLVMPQRLVDQLDDDHLSMVIAHELAHIRRHDHVVRWFELAVLAIFWWHPVAWWARRERAVAADQCCDAIVLQLGERRTYAEALLQTAEFLAGQAPAPLPAVAIGSGGSLERRCRHVLSGSVTSSLGWLGSTLSLLAILALPVSCQFSQQAGSAPDAEVSEMAALGTISDHLENPFRIQPYLQAAVKLQAMEERDRVEWLTRHAKSGRYDEQVIVLCRMLFQAKDGGEYGRPMLGAPQFVGKASGPAWPLEPIAVFKDVPIVVVRGYALAGHPESASSYLKYCLNTCRWTSRKYREIDDEELEKRLDEFVIFAALARRQLTADDVLFVKQQGGFHDDFASYVSIAAINPKAADRVIALLDANGIPNIVEGSVIYGVSVRPSQFGQALALLKADAAKHGYHAVFQTPEQIQEQIAGRAVVRAGYRDRRKGGDWTPVDVKAAAALDQFVRRFAPPYQLPPGWDGPAPSFAPPTHDAFLELKNGTRIEYELIPDFILINRREGTPEKLNADRAHGWERHVSSKDPRWEAGVMVINNVLGKSIARAAVRQPGDGNRWKPVDAKRADRLDRFIRRHAVSADFFTSKGKKVPAVPPTHEFRFELQDGTRISLKRVTDEPLIVRTEESAGKSTESFLEGYSLVWDPPNDRDGLVELIRELTGSATDHPPQPQADRSGSPHPLSGHVGKTVALAGRISTPAKPLQAWVLTTSDGAVYVPDLPGLDKSVLDQRVVIRGVLRHSPLIRAPEGAAGSPEYYYFDKTPVPTVEVIDPVETKGQPAPAQPPAVERRVTLPIDEAEAIAAVYVLDWGLEEPVRGPNLIAAVWGDGKVVWSKDRVRGGAPYLGGRIDAKRLTDLVARLDRDGAFGDESLSHAQFGPDSKHTTIVVNSGTRRLKLQSWHELFETNEKLVATSSGITTLDGRRREDVLQEDTAEYRHFRSTWDRIRAAVGVLVPKQGEANAGTLVQEAGIVSWRE